MVNATKAAIRDAVTCLLCSCLLYLQNARQDHFCRCTELMDDQIITSDMSDQGVSARCCTPQALHASTTTFCRSVYVTMSSVWSLVETALGEYAARLTAAVVAGGFLLYCARRHGQQYRAEDMGSERWQCILS